MKPNNHPNQNKEPEDGFQSLGSLFDAMQGRLFDGLQIVPEDAEARTKSEKPKKKAGPKLNQNQKKQELAKQGQHITTHPDEAELAFQARAMMQCTLPHRDPGDVPIWARRNGDLTVLLQPGYNSKTLQSYGLPFGEIPRLLLIWIVTEAVRTKSRHIKLDDDKSTLSGFLRAIGTDPKTGRGKRGDAKRVKDQMLRLFSCRISFENANGTANQGRVGRLNMEVASETQLWWDFKNPEQDGFVKSEVILGENFYKAITTRPIPINLRAIIVLKKNLNQSSFALDVYMWMTWRIFTMRDKKQISIRIPLELLKDQFGSGYTRLSAFKDAFEEALNNVFHVLPSFEYRFEEGVFVLVDSEKAPAIPSRDPDALKRRLEKPHKEISAKTRAWFAEHYGSMGLSLEEAIQDFNYWISGAGTGHRIEPRDVNALFKAFVRDSWAKYIDNITPAL